MAGFEVQILNQQHKNRRQKFIPMPPHALSIAFDIMLLCVVLIFLNVFIVVFSPKLTNYCTEYSDIGGK